jgi:hypothetical protein
MNKPLVVVFLQCAAVHANSAKQILYPKTKRHHEEDIAEHAFFNAMHCRNLDTKTITEIKSIREQFRREMRQIDRQS